MLARASHFRNPLGNADSMDPREHYRRLGDRIKADRTISNSIGRDAIFLNAQRLSRWAFLSRSGKVEIADKFSPDGLLDRNPLITQGRSGELEARNRRFPTIKRYRRLLRIVIDRDENWVARDFHKRLHRRGRPGGPHPDRLYIAKHMN